MLQSCCRALPRASLRYVMQLDLIALDRSVRHLPNASAFRLNRSEGCERIMIIEHRSRTPQIDKLAYVAPNAVICGEVSVGRGSRIMFGACVIAEDSAISIG